MKGIVLIDLSLFDRPIMNLYRKENRLDDETHQLLLNLRIKTEPVIQYEASMLDVNMHELVICSKLDPGEDKYECHRLQHRLYDKLANKDGLMELPNFYKKLDLLTKLCIHPMTAYKDYQNLSAFSEGDEQNKDIWKCLKGNPDGTIGVSRKISLVVTLILSMINTSVNDKAVIASSSKVLLEKLEKLLARPTTQYHTDGGFQTVRYDGDTTEKRRDDILKRFKDAPHVRVLLLSCKAGKSYFA
jgi:SNF2 family DNA or RNA helicase